MKDCISFGLRLFRSVRLAGLPARFGAGHILRFRHGQQVALVGRIQKMRRVDGACLTARGALHRHGTHAIPCNIGSHRDMP